MTRADMLTAAADAHDSAKTHKAAGDQLADHGAHLKARAEYSAALELELRAIELGGDRIWPIGVLHRSAAWCAVHAGDPAKALELAKLGRALAGVTERMRGQLDDVASAARAAMEVKP